MDTQAVRAYLLDLQDRITTAAGALDGGTFATDSWEKPPTERLRGSGRTASWKAARCWSAAASASHT